MAERRDEAQRTGSAAGWGRSLLAGAGAGAVAGLLSVGIEIVTRAQAPPRVATFWSAVAAGVLAGLLYAWLSRAARRPVAAFWIISLGIATVDSLLIAFLPMPEGRGPLPGLHIAGLMTPLRQLAALVGVGRLGQMHYPGPALPVVTAVHYMTAVVPCLLVPRWANPR